MHCMVNIYSVLVEGILVFQAKDVIVETKVIKSKMLL